MVQNNLSSDFQIKKQKRDKEIYARYCELMHMENAMSSKVCKIIMSEFGISSSTTIWNVRKKFANHEYKNHD